MGSRNSKGTVASSSSVAVRAMSTRSKGAWVFGSCFGNVPGSSDADDEVCDYQIEEPGRLKNDTCTDKSDTESDQVKHENCAMAKSIETNQVPSIPSNLEFDECGQASVTHTSSAAGSSSRQTVIAQSLNPSSRFCSCFRLLRKKISFRLNRAASSSSSDAYSLLTTSLAISNNGAGCHVNNSFHCSVNHDGSQQDVAVASSHISQCPDASFGGVRLEHSASAFSVHLQNDEIASSQDVARSDIPAGTGPSIDVSSGSNHTETERFETRCPYRRIRAQEPVEGSAQFCRTLSVGRLRDRVLRRTTSNEGTFGYLQEDSVVGDIRQGHGRWLWGDVAGAASDGNSAILQDSSRYCPSGDSSSSLNSRQESDLDSPQLGGQSNSHDLLEHGTSFLERRRRARSQIRALQRLGNRFENLAGHDRSCILSGQHHTGRCLCQTSTPTNGMDDGQSTRASISRIVVLAEALFEVLDEIHQQSVILPSQPSVSSLGSVPAPEEVVECMPLRIYARPHKHQIEEAAQCYICLVEYEEGDRMRVLPCHHEFHQTCVDKWLKEIHRVCPLCRGDVCRSNLSSLEKVD